MKTQVIKLALLGMLWLCAASSAAHAGTVTYVYTDPQGTPLAEADFSGTITARFDYAPYGQSVASMGAAPNGPGYTGHVNDPDTGLVYMQARYYDPEVGRFLSVDPVGPEAGKVFNFNRFKYAANNPYSFKDPDGRQECRSCEMSYGAAVGYMMRNDPEGMRVWSSGEAAATSTAGHGTAAVDGAAIGQAVGAVVDTGNVSKEAVVTIATITVTAILTHGRSTGSMHGPSPRIHVGQQGKHQVGHNNYQPGRSVLTADPSVLGRRAGTGQQVGKIDVGLPGSKERVNFGESIGTYVDEAGNASTTANGIIHYGKDGIHIVPSRP